MCDRVRPGINQQFTRRYSPEVLFRTAGPGFNRDTTGKRLCHGCTHGSVTPELLKTAVKIHILAAQPALGQDDSKLGRGQRLSPCRSDHHYMGKANRQVKPGIDRPTAVMHPESSMASKRCNICRASCSAARGGESRKQRVAESAIPKAAQSRTRPVSRQNFRYGIERKRRRLPLVPKLDGNARHQSARRLRPAG